MCKRFLMPAALLAAAFIFIVCGRAAAADSNFRETIEDMKILWQAYEDAEAFQDEYRIEMWKAGRYIESFKTGNYTTRMNVLLLSAKLITSERGRLMARDGIEMYDKYSPHAVRILEKHCPIGSDGRISDSDIRRTAKKVATSYMFYEWSEHPFLLTIQPWKLASTYRMAYDKTYESLKLYQGAVELWYDDNPVSKLLRNLSGIDTGFDIDDYDIHDLIRLLDYDDFDPNDALHKINETEAVEPVPAQRIRRDETPDF